MKILKQGIIQINYTQTCKYCKCVYEYTLRDVSKVPIIGIAYTFCPSCFRTNRHRDKSINNPS